MKAKLTKLPTDKSVDPAVQILIPLGLLGIGHAFIALTLQYVANQRLQGAILVTGITLGLYLGYRAYKGAEK